MPNYEHTTRLALRNKVQQKLGDGGIHWLNDELDLSINEALLTFGALSGFWKDNIFLLTEENKIIYDLFEDSNINKNLIKPSITYNNILDWLNKDLMENLSQLSPSTEFISLDTIIKSLETKYNQYQQLTSLVVKQDELEIAAEQNTIILPEDLIDIRRISFVSEDDQEYILDESDEEAVHLYSDSLNEISIPQYFSTLYGETKNLKLFPTPANTGILKILYVVGLKNSSVIDLDTVVNLPNNLVPYLKFGIEADIFSNEGVFNDPIRAEYCRRRWEEGILIGQNYTTALIAKTNNDKQMSIDSLNNVDSYSDETKVRTSPTVLGFAGLNIFRTDVIPSEVQYSIMLLCNSNAKLPEDDTDFIRIDLEYIDILADYVVHLAKFRNGAAEVAMTNNLKDNFMKVSINHNRRLLQAGITFDNLLGITKKQEKEQARIPIEV